MKKLIIKKIFIEIDTSTELQQGEQVLFDEEITISGGNFISTAESKMLVHNPGELYELVNKKQDEIPFFTGSDLKLQGSVTTIKTTPLPGRASTVEEQKLITNFIFNRDNEDFGDIFTPFFISFDVSESFVFVFVNYCNIDLDSDSHKKVTTFSERFTIKHGMVYEYNEKHDFEEDITEIKNLLNNE